MTIAVRSRTVLGAVLLAAALLCPEVATSNAAAQVTPGADTVTIPIPPDAVDPDTLLPDSLRQSSVDTIRSMVFPRFPSGLPTGWAHARWEWSREAIWKYHGLTLLDFLERAPGLSAIRAGDHGYPAGLTALGMGGSRVRVFLDGFEMDPLGFTTPDLQHIPLIDLETVRVERDLAGIRIDLIPLRLPDNRPLSVIEAATGMYDSKLLRGALVRGMGKRNVLTAAYDAVSTDGFRFDYPYNSVSARAAWSYAISERTGLQAEFRTGGIERGAQPYVESADQRLILLRARTTRPSGLAFDAAVGRAWRKPAAGDILTENLESTQATVRASLATARAWGEATVRVRDEALNASTLPRIEAGGRAALRPLPWVAAEGSLQTSEVDGEGSLLWNATLRAGRTAGLNLFGTVSGGREVLGLVRDTSIEVPDGDDRLEPRFSVTSSTVAAVRAGAEWFNPGFAFGVAGVALSESTVVPFGLAFDRGFEQREVDAATGIEGHASVLLPRTRGLARVEGWGNYWLDTGDRPYLPEYDARGSLIVSGLFYGGQLEPTLRYELAARGTMQFPELDATLPYQTTRAYLLSNLLLQIRIIDVQVFGRWDNVLVNAAENVPGRILPGQRLVYGLRWVFRN